MKYFMKILLECIFISYNTRFLNDNRLQGNVPWNVFEAKNLEILYFIVLMHRVLDNNSLDGILPLGLAKCQNLRILYVLYI